MAVLDCTRCHESERRDTPHISHGDGNVFVVGARGNMLREFRGMKGRALGTMVHTLDDTRPRKNTHTYKRILEGAQVRDVHVRHAHFHPHQCLLRESEVCVCGE